MVMAIEISSVIQSAPTGSITSLIWDLQWGFLRGYCLCLALYGGLTAGYLTVVVSNKIDLAES